MDRSIKCLINTITKFHLNADDIVIITVDRYISTVELEKIESVMKTYFSIAKGIIIPNDVTIECLSEKAMNKLGWYRKP